MIKNKKKNVHLPLVVTGYILFSLLVIATLISTTIPLGRMLFNPNVLHFNVVVILIAFTIGSLLPILLGYSIGDHSIKTKSKLSHHFTGVLFGLLAYWIMISLGFFITIPPEFSDANRNLGIIVANTIPSIGVLIIATILSIAHLRSRHAKQEILHYRPFFVTFLIAVVVLPLWLLINDGLASRLNFGSFGSLIIVAVLGVASYATLYGVKLNKYAKVAWSLVSVSVLYVAVFTFIQLVPAVSNYFNTTPTAETQVVQGWIGFVLALAVWGVYWFKQIKALR